MKLLLFFGKFLRFLKRAIIFLMSIVFGYFVIAVLLSLLKTHPLKLNCPPENEIFITTNGVHLDIILPIDNVEFEFLKKLEILPGTKYLAFGWGDKQFYINTPEWKDLTIKTAFIALFLKSETAMHITCYFQKQNSWDKLNICTSQNEVLNRYIENSFQQDEKGSLQKIDFPGYYKTDLFYEAKGSFSLFNTCNVWVNRALKVTGIETSLWSPFDLGILYHLPE